MKKIFLGSKELSELIESLDPIKLRKFLRGKSRRLLGLKDSEVSMMLTLRDIFKNDYLLTEITDIEENDYYHEKFIEVLKMVPSKVFSWKYKEYNLFYARYSRKDMLELTKNSKLSLYWRVRYAFMENNQRCQKDEPSLDYSECIFPINRMSHGWFKYSHLVDSELKLGISVGWARVGKARLKHYFVVNNRGKALSLCKKYEESLHHTLHMSKSLKDFSEHCKTCERRKKIIIEKNGKELRGN